MAARSLTRRESLALLTAAVLPAQAPVEWVCPMDPDVRAHKPERCRKCGMALVAGLPTPEEYPVEMDVLPAAPRAGREIALRFRVKHPRTNAPAVLRPIHEKLFHLFLVSKDLSVFRHDHPRVQSDGSFVHRVTLFEGGMYRLLCDFYPEGGTPQMIAKTMFLRGPELAARMAPDLAPKSGENVTVRLRTDPEQPLAGKRTMLFFGIHPADGLEQYLGASGHLLAASLDLVDMIHTHPAWEGGGANVQFKSHLSEARPASRVGPVSTPRHRQYRSVQYSRSCDLTYSRGMPAFTRRDLLMCAAAASLPVASAASNETLLPICAFSKHFQWTDVRGAAEAARDLGFDALDLTVRPNGHVLPERVADDLPKAAEAIRAADLRLAMITTDVIDPKTPHAENVLKTFASLGGKRYRWDGFKYDLKRGLPEQLAGMKPRVKDLAAMNKHYGLCAMYHTHSGVGRVGASMWDLHSLLKDLDPDTVSVNYDIGHATVEGGFGGWVHSARLLLPSTRGIAVKDFRWKQNDKGEWIPGWCPMGDGMVNFKRFLPMMKEAGFTGPLQLHMEYPELGSAAHGSSTSSIPKDKLLVMMRQDVTRFKAMLAG